MSKPLKDVTGDSSTQEAGENPTDQEKSYEDKAHEILDEFNKRNDPKKEEEKETPPADDKGKKHEDKKSTDAELKKQQEELKIPLSRLNKEIEKKNDYKSKYEKAQQQLEEERKRLAELDDDEKEEHQMYKKLGLETKESRLQEKVDEYKDMFESSQERIKELEDQVNASKVKTLSARIEELTEKHDGSDGLPKFDIKELLEFGKAENYMPDDPIKLYNLKYQNEIIAQKYAKKGSEVDKGNKDTFSPTPKKIKGFNDPEFEKEALAIINSVT